MAKLASSSTFALDLLRRLLCAHSAGNGSRAGEGGGTARRDETRGPATLETEPEGRSPCIVARLMGLDAMPAAEGTPHGQPLPLRRSRSASSAEGWPPPPPRPGGASPVRASASLREKPAYLRPESDEFLVLSFSPQERERDLGEDAFLLASASDTDAETRRGGRGPDGGAKKMTGNRRRRRRLRFGDDEAESTSSGSRRMAAASGCDMQNSSPVSVLEARDGHEESSTTTTSSSLEEAEHAEPCSASSVEESQFTLEQQSSGRKLHPDVDHLDDVSTARSSCRASRSSDKERRNSRVMNKSESITPDVAAILQPICRLVEEDLKNMEWLTRDGANIVVAEMESGILDQLVCEAIDELAQLSSDDSPVPSAQEAPMSVKCSGNRRTRKNRCSRDVLPFCQDKQLEATEYGLTK
ncbi:hypothetical protein ACP70R_048350 [Stipagrostis hirtigluma subsp. patula]